MKTLQIGADMETEVDALPYNRTMDVRTFVVDIAQLNRV